MDDTSHAQVINTRQDNMVYNLAMSQPPQDRCSSLQRQDAASGDSQDALTECDCGYNPQTMQHILQCPPLPEFCRPDDQTVYSCPCSGGGNCSDTRRRICDQSAQNQSHVPKATIELFDVSEE